MAANNMQKFVMQNVASGAPQPNLVAIEDDKTITQGQFTQPPRQQYHTALASENVPLSPRLVALSTARSASAAAAARQPILSGEFVRQGPSRPASAHPLEPTTRDLNGAPPFWEGSTIDGGAFSDSASNLDSDEHASLRRSRLRTQQTLPPQTHRQQDSTTRLEHRFKPEPTATINAYTIGPDNLMSGVESAAYNRPMGPGLATRRSHTSRVADLADFPDTRSSSPDPQSPSTSRRSHRTRQVKVSAARHPDAKARQPGPVAHNSHAQQHERDKAPAGRVPAVPDMAAARRGIEIDDEHDLIYADSLMSESMSADSDHLEEVPTPKAAKKSTRANVADHNSVNRRLFEGGAAINKNVQDPPASASQESPARVTFPTAKKRALDSRLEPDYDDKTLASMQFAKLQKQDFDFDPAKAEALSAEIPQGTLDEKLRHFVRRDKESQSEFFQKMSVRDWEDSGDWFLERFGEVVNKFKTARKERRAIADRFETEVATRADSVQTKIERIDETLASMKQEGKGLMQRDFD